MSDGEFDGTEDLNDARVSKPYLFACDCCGAEDCAGDCPQAARGAAGP